MKILLKSISWMLSILTLLFVVYFAMLIYDMDFAMQVNETYYLYVYIQTLHVLCSLSVLFVVWSNTLFDRWKQIDQTLIILFLSVIGLWIWYFNYYPKYKRFQSDID